MRVAARRAYEKAYQIHYASQQKRDVSRIQSNELSDTRRVHINRQALDVLQAYQESISRKEEARRNGDLSRAEEESVIPYETALAIVLKHGSLLDGCG